MGGKLANSWALVKASAEVLRADKELLVFPLLSSLCLLLVAAAFLVPLVLLRLGAAAVSALALPDYLLLFLFYVVQYFLMIFFNSALVGAAQIRLAGGEPTVADGLRAAFARLGPIFGYAVIAASVGLALRFASRRGGALGRGVAALGGIGWSLATYLVVPVLVARRVGPIEAIKESASILRRTWGEQIAGSLGIGFVFGLFALAFALLAAPVIVLAASLESGAALVAAGGGTVLGFILLALIGSALQGIYSAALHRFATTGEAAMFEPELLQGAFRPA